MRALGAPSSGPLSVPVFRALWIATIVSNIGTWMNDVGAGWLMTTLRPDPLMVALVQAATTLPMFLLALPAGALADIFDRRKLLIGAQIFSLLAASLLAATTLLGLTTPWLLLGFTCLIAIGSALSAPAFQAVVSELVSGADLQRAVTLNGLAVNIARAIGPALGGVLVAMSGPGGVFALNAISTVGVVLVLVHWQRTVPAPSLPPEHFIGALRAGARYALGSDELQTVLFRAFGFFLFASGFWALLPLIARQELGLGPTGYGGLLAFMGLGAVAGAALLPQMRSRLSTNGLTIAASLTLAAAMVALSFAKSFQFGALALLIGGFAWIAMMAALNGGAQVSAASWVKARSLAVYLLVFQGAMTAGSMVWGLVAGQIGIASTLHIAAAALAVATIVLARWKPLGRTAALDLTPSLHWPAPILEGEVEADQGPVLVTIEYQIDPERFNEFKHAMQALERVRRRDGAISWGLYEDVSRRGLILEHFIAESWLEHLRQHERVTKSDQDLQNAAKAFHIGDKPPSVRHLLAKR